MFAFLIELTPGQSELIRNCGKVFVLLFGYAVGYALLSYCFELAGAKQAFPKFPFHVLEYCGAFLVMWALFKYRGLLFKMFLGFFAVCVVLEVVDGLIKMF
jgi:hypothetical protein